MSDMEYQVAVRTGVLNDEGIDLQNELMAYYPREARQMHIQSELAAGKRQDLAGYTELAAEILGNSPAEVQAVWALSIKLAEENQRWQGSRS